jgi:hypothetical protein
MIAESSFQAGVFRQPWTRRRTLTSVREDALEHPSSSIGQTMHNSTQPMTPLAAVAAGLLAGAVGTVGLDAVHYLKYRRAGVRKAHWPGSSRRSSAGMTHRPRDRSPGA